MCMELIYENSPSKDTVKFDYLAVGENILINEYDGECGKQVWARFEQEDEPVMTALISFEDVDVDKIELGEDLAKHFSDWSSKWKWFTLQGQLTNLYNNEMFEELYYNFRDMIEDSLAVCDLNEDLKSVVNEVVNEDCYVKMTTVDFCMHKPDDFGELEIHPGYDT